MTSQEAFKVMDRNGSKVKLFNTTWWIDHNHGHMITSSNGGYFFPDYWIPNYSSFNNFKHVK